MQKLLHHISILNNKNDQIVSSDLKCREKEIPNRNMIMIIFYRTHIYYQRKGKSYYPNHTIYGEQQQPNKETYIFDEQQERKRGQAMAWILILFFVYLSHSTSMDPCIYVIAFFYF